MKNARIGKTSKYRVKYIEDEDDTDEQELAEKECSSQAEIVDQLNSPASSD